MERFFWNLYAFFYDSLARNYIPYQKLVNQVKTIVFSSCPQGSLILDVGCGTGNYCLALADNYKVCGIDLSPEMLKRAESKAKKKNIRASFQVSNLSERLPYEDDIFDAVISVNTLYSLPDPDFALRQIRRVLKNNGKLILCNPMYPPPMGKIIAERVREEGLIRGLLLLVRLGSVILLNQIILRKMHKGSYSFWNTEEISKLLTSVGFKVEYTDKTYALKANVICLASKG